MQLWLQLVEARVAAGITQTELAKRLGVTPVAVGTDRKTRLRRLYSQDPAPLRGRAGRGLLARNQSPQPKEREPTVAEGSA